MTKKTLSWVCKHNYFKYLQLFKMKDTSISKDTKYFTLLTWEFPVHNVDSPVQQKGALLLNPPGCCYSSPALSSWRSGRWELRPKFHSFFLTDHKHLAWRRINYKTNIKKNLLVSSWKFNADDTMNSLYVQMDFHGEAIVNWNSASPGCMQANVEGCHWDTLACVSFIFIQIESIVYLSTSMQCHV